MNKLLRSTIVCFLSISTFSFSQILPEETPNPNVIPPSPEAAALGSFGTVPVGLYTGSAQFSVPLYTVQGINLSVPVTLNYSTNGIKLEDISTWAGAGWTLDAGGLISRTVLGKPDETHQFNGFPDTNTSCFEFEDAMKFRNGGDLEYDVFSYNFLGNSGSFIVKNYEVIPIEKNNLVFSTISASLNEFIIKDGQGTRYYFGGNDNGNQTPIEFTQANQSGSVKTAWYLTKIVHHTGETIYFEYTVDDTLYHYDGDYSQIIKQGLNEVQEHPYVITIDPWYNCIQCNNSTTNIILPATHNTYRHNTAYLKSIYTYNMSDRVDFKTTNRSGDYGNLKKLTAIEGKTKKIAFNISEATWYRLYLNSISINSFLNIPNEIYSFEYIPIATTPLREGFYRDHWGYYNGKINANYVSGATHEANVDATITGQGALNKITYPTKGYTTIEYEPNSKTLPGGSFSNCNSSTTGWIVGAQIYGNSTPGYIEDFSFTINNSQEVTFNLIGEYFPNLNPNVNGSTTGHARFTIINEDTGEIFANENLYGNDDNTVTTFLPAGNYSLNFTVKSHIYHVRASYTICATYSPNVPLKTLTGGIRVKETNSYSKQGELSLSKSYVYEEEKIAPILKTRYSYNFFEFDYDSCNPTGYIYIPSYSFIYPYCVFKNRLSNPTFGDNQSAFPCFYGKVTEKLTDASKTFFKSEITHKFKSAAFISVPQLIFDHTNLYSYSKYGNNPAHYSTSGLPYEYQTLEYENTSNLKLCVKDTKFNYDFLSDSVELHASYLVDNITQLRYGFTSTNQNGADCVSVDQLAWELNAWRYFHVSAYKSLKSQVVTEYFYPENYNPNLHNEMKLVTTTNYFYENPEHRQVTKTESDTSSKALGLNTTKKKITRFYYPSDITNPNIGMIPYSGGAFSATEIQALSSMVNQNRKNIPVQIENYSSDNELLSIKRTTYKNFPFTNQNNSISYVTFPEKIKFMKVGAGSNNTLEDKMIYSKYGRFGSILEEKKAYGPMTSYVYGYQGRYIIGALENFSYDQLIPYTSTIENLDQYPDHSSISNFFNQLRVSFPNSNINSFTYYPSVGIRSKTDEKGDLYQFTYDEFNRLKSINDINKFIVKEFEYNYRP